MLEALNLILSIPNAPVIAFVDLESRIIEASFEQKYEELDRARGAGIILTNIAYA